MERIPYPTIARCLRHGQIVPVLGAGASACDRGEGTEWHRKEEKFPPLGSEFAEELARDGFPEEDSRDRRDLPRVASYYEHVAGDRRLLVEELQKVFGRHYEPHSVHHLLASLEGLRVIITTNYDSMIEAAFDHARRPYHLVVHDTASKENANSVLWRPAMEEEFRYDHPDDLPEPNSKHPLIYKIHGGILSEVDKSRSFVITEEDYIDYLATMGRKDPLPAKTMLELSKSHLLFLGYGLRDWNFRVLLLRMRNPSARPIRMKQKGDDDKAQKHDEDRERLRSWAIQKHPSEVESNLWRVQKVNLYDIALAEFVDRLKKEDLSPQES